MMGDIIELTTWPSHPNVFYKMTGSALCFEVKAPGNAVIGLAKEVGRKCDILIALGYNRHTWIKNVNSNSSKKCETPNILSSDEYRTFWITWNAGCIRLGRNNETKPIVLFCCKMHNLQYVTFSVIGQQSRSVHWKFTVPPLLQNPTLKAITGGELYWAQVDPETQFPDEALIGGYENENLYIIRASHRGSLTPGKFVSSEGLGYIPWGGEANEKNSFEVLCGFDCVWVPSGFDKIPVGAVVGGQSENQEREKLYIGRVRHNNHLIPGKIQPSHKVCYIAYEGAEIANEEFEILVASKKTHVSNEMLVPHIDLGGWNDNRERDNNDEDDDEEDDGEDEDDDGGADEDDVYYDVGGLNYYHPHEHLAF